MSAAVAARGLGVRFQFDRQGRPVTPAAARMRRRCAVSWGLKGVDLEVGPGESVALVGDNGAGKTTLLRAIAGVLAADEGTIEVSGRVGPLLSNDAGLMPHLTGRESCRLLGVLLGLSRAQARALADVVRPPGALGPAFDRPVSTYSQGMRARLGFEVLMGTGPEVLLLDEVHEAVDHEFRAVVERHAERITAEGGIVFAAGHDHEALAHLCARAVHLADGTIRHDGPFDEVTRAYVAEPAGA